MAALITCTTCQGLGANFAVPYDNIGVALMEEHLLTEHGFKTNATKVIREALAQRDQEPKGD